jgi:hypothetical protein
MLASSSSAFIQFLRFNNQLNKALVQLSFETILAMDGIKSRNTISYHPWHWLYWSNNMHNLLTIRNLLRILTLAAWIVALLWFFSARTYEPLLAFITGTVTLLASFAVPDKKGGVHIKNVKAGRNIETTDETGSGVDMDGAEAGQDIITIEK